MAKSKIIVLAHGMFVNNTSWSNWKSYLESKGYTVYNPANPGHEGSPEDLRKNIHPELVKTGFEDVVNNLSAFIDTLPEKPLVIGHSMAGLATQKLVELGKAEAGVSISGAPPKNVMAPFSTVKIVWPAVSFFASKGYFMGSKEWYNKAFFNLLSKDEQEKAYFDVAVPESRKIGRDPLLKSFGKVNFKEAHVPLLFIGAQNDAIFPNSLTKKNANKYSDSNSRVDLKFFDGKSHFICGEPGWKEVADYIINWHENLK
jgi:pimeloyl-ACP methyl ester carboxylesterase